MSEEDYLYEMKSIKKVIKKEDDYNQLIELLSLYSDYYFKILALCGQQDVIFYKKENIKMSIFFPYLQEELLDLYQIILKNTKFEFLNNNIPNYKEKIKKYINENARTSFFEFNNIFEKLKRTNILKSEKGIDDSILLLLKLYKNKNSLINQPLKISLKKYNFEFLKFDLVSDIKTDNSSIIDLLKEAYFLLGDNGKAFINLLIKENRYYFTEEKCLYKNSFARIVTDDCKGYACCNVRGNAKTNRIFHEVGHCFQWENSFNINTLLPIQIIFTNESSEFFSACSEGLAVYVAFKKGLKNMGIMVLKNMIKTLYYQYGICFFKKKLVYLDKKVDIQIIVNLWNEIICEYSIDGKIPKLNFQYQLFFAPEVSYDYVNSYYLALLYLVALFENFEKTIQLFIWYSKHITSINFENVIGNLANILNINYKELYNFEIVYNLLKKYCV